MSKGQRLNLRKRLQYERLLNTISFFAVNTESLATFLEKSLELIGETLHVSRVYIFEHNHQLNTMNNAFEWTAPGIKSEKDHLQGISADTIPWWDSTLKSNEIICFKDIEDIPDEYAKEILRPQKIKSILVVPLFLGQIYYGFIGLDQCQKHREWTNEDINLLLSISRIMIQAVLRKRAEEALEIKHLQLLSLFDSISESIYVADMENYQILYANKTAQETFQRHLIGETCYQALQGLDAPCDFCTNSMIKKMNYQPYRWESHNAVVNRDYQLIDRVIHWPGGKDVRFEMAIDITKRKQAEEALAAEKEQLKVTLHSIGDGVITTDKIGRIVMINEVAEKLTGWSREEASGKLFDTVFHIIDEKTRQKCENPVEKVLKTGESIELANHTTLITKEGLERPIADSAAPIKDQKGNILGVVLVFRDVTAERMKKEAIVYLSYHDRLTGLYNRAFFEEETKRLDTERQLPITLIMGDVNGLKMTNDVYGHREGDILLKSIARILKESCRSEDLIARWGGDEFVILLPKTPDNVANEICKRIRKACSKESSETCHLSISLGYATKEKADEDIMSVLKKAEDFMYKRKLLESKSLRSSIVSSMKKTLFEKSHETEEHAERLGRLSKKIGSVMGLSENEMNELELLSVLHDIGKIAINDSILLKPGELTDEEWREMKKHAGIGYRIAQSAPELTQIAEYILSHHERWDGAGYPQGLTGENIPLLARILTVVDAFDAMINDRPYRKALSIKEATEELKQNAGKQFDPQIVQVFLEHVLGMEKVEFPL